MDITGHKSFHFVKNFYSMPTYTPKSADLTISFFKRKIVNSELNRMELSNVEIVE